MKVLYCAERNIERRCAKAGDRFRKRSRHGKGIYAGWAGNWFAKGEGEARWGRA